MVNVDKLEQLTAVPWILLLLVAVPLVALARFTKTFPTLRFLWLAVVPVVLGVVVIRWPQLLPGLVLFDGIFVVLLVLDAATLPTHGQVRRGVTAERSVPRTTSIGVATTSELLLLNRTRYRLRGRLVDDVPETFTAQPDGLDVNLAPQAKLRWERELVGQQRGGFELQYAYLQTVSRLGLWQRQFRLPVESRINVYPDMQQLSEYALLARTDRLSQIGVRKTRKIGQDSDFERLRDYTPDDNYRHIDWRSTARRNRLTVRQFQTDQSQRVIFMLDCGRMMTNERAGLTLLDHALNACLMLSYVALSQGDSVGMLCFSDQVHAYIPPRGGRNHLNRLLQAGFDQFPRMVESRYDSAFLYLSNHCKRRSLVVLTTNVIDEVNAGQVVDYLGNLVGQHLPLGVLMRDRQLFEAADHPERGKMGMYRAAVAAEILCWRDQVIRDLRHRGSLALDLFPEEMTAPLVNEYLRVKAKHLL